MDLTEPGNGELVDVITEVTGMRSRQARAVAGNLISAYVALNPVLELDPEHLTRDDHATILGGLAGLDTEPEIDPIAKWVGRSPWAQILVHELRATRRTFSPEDQAAAVFVATPPDVAEVHMVARHLFAAFGAVRPAAALRRDVNNDGLARMLSAVIELRPTW